MDNQKPILTITGSDSTGASGIQADARTIAALGGYAVTAITSVTVQTTLGIQEFYDLPGNIVQGQIEAVMNDMQPRVVKIGMVRTREVLDVIVTSLRRYRPEHVIYDPVFRSAQGEVLVERTLVDEILERLLPLCTLVVRPEQQDMHGRANCYASAVAFYLNEGCNETEAQERAGAYVATHFPRTDLHGRSSELYADFLTAISRHLHTNGDVHFYAERLNVSPRYLSQVTRRIAGHSPKAIIDRHIMEAIEKELKSSTRTIQEIAYAYGFSSQAHLTRFFKKYRGMSPTAFRKA